WTPCVFAKQIGITFVIWMNGDGGVGHDRLRPSRCHFQKTSRAFDDFISNEIEIAFLWLGNDFLVGERRLGGWVPINHPAAAINQGFIIELDKNAQDSPNVPR